MSVLFPIIVWLCLLAAVAAFIIEMKMWDKRKQPLDANEFHCRQQETFLKQVDYLKAGRRRRVRPDPPPRYDDVFYEGLKEAGGLLGTSESLLEQVNQPVADKRDLV